MTGRGGKFDFLSFTMNLGSGLALLGLASVLCDVIVLNIMRNRKLYRNAKFDTVEQDREAALAAAAAEAETESHVMHDDLKQPDVNACLVMRESEHNGNTDNGLATEVKDAI